MPKTVFRSLFKTYAGAIASLVVLAIIANVLSLFFPRLVAQAIDTYVAGAFSVKYIAYQFIGLSSVVFIVMLGQSIMQVFVAEKTASWLRTKMIDVLSRRSYQYIREKTPGSLLTNLTSDVNAVKDFVSSALPALFSSVIALIGASILILKTDWHLGLYVLAIVPIIAITFVIAFSKMGILFRKTQESIDSLNRVINTNIVGASLVRVLHSGKTEEEIFDVVNDNAQQNGIALVKVFSGLIPIVMFASNIASLAILYIGGKFVIYGNMTLGTFVAFSGYVSILIFPIFIIGFTSNAIGRAKASLTRIQSIMNPDDDAYVQSENLEDADITGAIEVRDVCMNVGEKHILSHINFKVNQGQRIAILGPTGGGKTQLLHIMAGLISPTSGTVLYDGIPLQDLDKKSLYKHIGFVFQDSILFNASLRENIVFGQSADPGLLNSVLEVAGLDGFIADLPQGLDTSVSERGLSLSGGQKQRIMLARALMQKPNILFLDDFTARIDAVTEKQIIEKLHSTFKGITLISVTQKIASVESYDTIIVLVEGEVVASGTHESLIHTSPEYAQIYESQKSTLHYELQS